MLQQPLRVGGLALASALATAGLALVTFVVSNLILGVVAGIGVTGGVVAPAAAGPPDAVEAGLMSADQEVTEDRRCPRHPHPRPQDGKRARCSERQVSGGVGRP